MWSLALSGITEHCSITALVALLGRYIKNQVPLCSHVALSRHLQSYLVVCVGFVACRCVWCKGEKAKSCV